ncbi:MAG: radical SAM protein [Candidatus Aenigmatarchaeota archaeon]
MKNKNNQYYYSFDWHLTDYCNFDCVYCHPQIKAVKNRPLPYSMKSDEVAKCFNQLKKRCLISLSGGEPFLYPDFINLCKHLTKGGNYLSINTNLSVRELIKQFAEEINPKFIKAIYASLHILERERLGLKVDDFINDCLLLQKKKFPLVVYYVMYPPLFSRFEKDCNYLKKRGIKVLALKIFKGFYQNKKYPDAYTEEERKKMIEYPFNEYNYTLGYLSGETYKTKGKLCRAGVNFFKVEVDGWVHRCPADEEDFGNLFKGTFKPKNKPYPCRVKEGWSLSQCKANLIL